jgi:hypothetical protein
MQSDGLLLSYPFLQLRPPQRTKSLVFAWVKAKPSLPQTPRLEVGWEMKVQFHAFETSARNGLRLSGAYSGQCTAKERGSAIHWGSTCPWATLEGFQMRKVLALAGNWTQTFLSSCLSLWRLNNAAPPLPQSSETKTSSGKICGCVRFDVLTAILREIIKPLKWHFGGYRSFERR